ncbi:MAG: helix-turn-helix domain-containing protein [Firmicutes bacterium]|nr:helix-turn-helix domain-containing protein [Bacillota bacterium]
MFKTSILSACLEGHILTDNMPERIDEFNYFRILGGDGEGLQEDYLHIARAKDLYSASRAETEKDKVYTVVVTDGDNVMDFYLESRNYHIIITDLSVVPIINSLSELADEYSRITSLRRHLRSSVSVADPMMEGAARAMKADCIYLSGRLRVISCFRAINCEEFSYLVQGGSLRPEHAAQLKDEWQEWSGGWVTRLKPLEYDGRVAGYLLVIMHKNSRDRFNSDLLEVLASSMTDFLRISYSDRSVADSRFSTLILDLIEGKVNDQEMLNDRLRLITNSLTGQFFMVLLESEDISEKVSAEAMLMITAIYPGAFPLQYDNKLVALVQQEKYSANFDFSEDALQHFAEDFHLYACVNSMTRNLLSIHADYDKAAKSLTFARTFCPDRSRRVFRAEEYAMYAVIDICFNAVRKEYHGDYIKLCSPGTISLRYYDDRHGTNNSELLKAYLLNGRNTTRTAAQFGLHRNTLMYRLDKIRTICAEDIDDPMTSFRMLFSLMTLEYIRGYQNRKTIYTPETDVERGRSEMARS